MFKEFSLHISDFFLLKFSYYFLYLKKSAKHWSVFNWNLFQIYIIQSIWLTQALPSRHFSEWIYTCLNFSTICFHFFISKLNRNLSKKNKNILQFFASCFECLKEYRTIHFYEIITQHYYFFLNLKFNFSTNNRLKINKLKINIFVNFCITQRIFIFFADHHFARIKNCYYQSSEMARVFSGILLLCFDELCNF